MNVLTPAIKGQMETVIAEIESDAHVGKPLLLSLGGSHAYGLSTPESDVDLRGFALPVARDVLLGNDFEQICHTKEPDVTVYSLAKACKLMAQCNPNMIELIGLDDDVVIASSEQYQTIRTHPEWFLSRRAAYTFGGYATAQLRRIKNAMARDRDNRELAKGEVRSLEATLAAMPESYPELKGRATFSFDDKGTDDDAIHVRVTVNATDVPATELAAFARQLDSARKSAETIGKNRRKESSKLAKHASHLIRLLHMGSEILEGKGVRTRRTEDAKLLADLKAGMWLDEDEDGRREYASEFWELLDESETRFQKAKHSTDLPEQPDLASLEDFIVEQHRKVVTDDQDERRLS